MKKQLTLTKTMILVLMSLCLLTANAFGLGMEKIEKTFKGVDIINAKIICGECIIEKGNNDEVKITLEYDFPKEHFTPIMEQEGNTLKLKEEFKESKLKNVKGETKWTLYVPAGIQLDLKSVSGDCRITGIKSDVSVKLVSGDLKLKDVTGGLELTTVSGDLKGEGLTLLKASHFKAVSGDIKVTLAKTPEHNVVMSNVSGAIILDYNGNGLKGSYVLKGQKGEISVPAEFDKKEDEESHSPFAKRTFSVGGETPQITLKTVSGELAIKK